MVTSDDKSYDWSHLYANEILLTDKPIQLKPVKVVKGFQRGSKELGCPTANLDMEELGTKGSEIETGIYYGWALLRDRSYKTVVSVGWNPFYKNEKKTIEAHLLEDMEDFYDEIIQVTLYGYLSQEANFNGLDELISCIKSDISLTRDRLDHIPCPYISSKL